MTACRQRLGTRYVLTMLLLTLFATALATSSEAYEVWLTDQSDTAKESGVSHL
jgi:hypothetical protein